MRKISSSKRIITQYKNVPLTDISLIQSAYANKDAQAIKKIFKKPNISDATALAYGRLANQYIALMNQPNKREIAYVKKRYKVLIGSNFQDNLLLMNNLPIKTPVKPKKLKFPQILQLNPQNTLNTLHDGWETIVPIFFPSDIGQFWNDISFSPQEETFIAQHVGYYRVYLKIKFRNKQIGIISSKKCKFPNFRCINYVYQNINTVIASTNYYTWQDNEIVDIVEEIVGIRVRWWK